jgi:hypothetical protein
MSAPGIALLPQESELPANVNSRRDGWWERLAHRCASPHCPHRAKLWPSWLRRCPGVEFDGRWYCELPCLKPFVAFRVNVLLSSFLREKPRSFRVPLGLLLVNRGAISHEQLRTALGRQREEGCGRIGDWFLELGMVTDQQLTQALGQQWGCPVFPLERQDAKLVPSDLVPVPLLESAFAVPAHASSNGRFVHLAFGDRVDHTLLYGVEQMLGCQTFACAASSGAIAHFLDHLRRTAAREEPCFDTIRDPREMTSIICSYAEKLLAGRISLVRAAAFLWVRFYRGHSTRDLLFRVLSGYPSPSRGRLPGTPKALSISADKGKDGVSDAPKLL